MAASLPGFTLASTLGPSQPREQELEELCHRQAEQIERLQDQADNPATLRNVAPSSQTGIRPDERQAIMQLLSDLGHRIEDLERTVVQQARAIADQEKEIRDLTQAIDFIQDSVPQLIAQDRLRLTTIEGRMTPAPQKKQSERAETLVAIVAAAGGKMMAKEARHRLNISESQFSQLLSSASDLVEVRPLHSDRRQNVILLK